MDYLYGGGLLPPKLLAFKIPAAGPLPSRTIIISSTIIDRICNFAAGLKPSLTAIILFRPLLRLQFLQLD